MNPYGIKNTRYFNKKTGAIVMCLTDGLELGEEWLNISDNPDWRPLFDIEGNYIGYTMKENNMSGFNFKEEE